MKIPILALISLIISISSFAQNCSGKVVDSENALELSNVKIESVDKSFSTISSENGGFIVPSNQTYIFSIEGYASKTIEILKNSKIIIQLTAIPEHLNEIIITSNNFKSQLKSTF